VNFTLKTGSYHSFLLLPLSPFYCLGFTNAAHLHIKRQNHVPALKDRYV
jgi:hypothetical protein